jgi:saccharopine dehydrogenase (NAD+, L-lysine-forming)
MPKAAEGTTIVVLGGAGAMGRITVQDLVRTAPSTFRIVVADAHEAAARALVTSLRDRRVTAARIDVSDARATAALLRGAFAVVSAVQHDHNLAIMAAALRARAHYVDLGGLFHRTRRQLAQHAAWKRAERLALLGMGAAPGVTNVLARSIADELEEVREIHVIVAGLDPPPHGDPAGGLGASYSLQTILEESTEPAALFTRGDLCFVEPMSGAIEVDFPAPVGRKRPVLTLHSELATLPQTYRRKGVREVSFRIAFAEDLERKLRFLRGIGASSPEALSLRKGGATVIPRDVLVAAMKRLPPPPPPKTPPPEHEILRVVVRGVREGRWVEEIADCHCAGIPAWGVGSDADTGCPPSIAVQLLARGEIQSEGPGARAPGDAYRTANLAGASPSQRRALSALSTLIQGALSWSEPC